MNNPTVPLILAILTLFCGVMVVIGAVFDVAILTKLLPFWLPMKSNAAVCFILLSGAIILSCDLPANANPKIDTFKRYLAQLLAILAGGFSFLTVLEYAFKVDFGIDNLLFSSQPIETTVINSRHLNLDAAFPNRIKLEAAFCFVLLSMAIVLTPSKQDFQRIIAASLGLSVIALSLASLTSYFSPQLGQFGWFGYGIMRMNAAFLLVLSGCAVVLLSWKQPISSWALDKTTTVPFILGLFLLVIIGFNSSRMQFWLNDRNDDIAFNEQINFNLETILANTMTMQTNVRGYIITQNDKFLIDFLNAKNKTFYELHQLSQITEHNPLYQNYVVNIIKTVHAQINWYNSVIATKQKGRTRFNELVQHGTNLAEKTQKAIRLFKEAHLQYTPELKQQLTQVSHLSYILICLGTLASVGIFLTVFFKLNAAEYQHKLAKSLMLESRSLLRIIIDTVPMGIYWKDHKLRYLGCNARFSKDAGVKGQNDLIGRTDEQLGWLDQSYSQHEDDLAIMKSGISKLHHDEVQSTLSGEQAWLRVSKVPLKDQNDAVIGLLGVYEDITRQKCIEESLKNSEERFRTLFTAAPVGIALIDSINGHIYFCNQKLADIVGLSLQEMLQIDWMTITHPDDIQTDLDNMVLMNSGKTSGFVMEKRYIHKNGSIVWINLTVAKVHLQEQGHPCHLCIVEDITERKRIQEALRDSELRYRTLAEHSPLAIQIYATDGTVKRVNAAWEKLWNTPISALKNYNVLHDAQLAKLEILPLLKRAFAGESVEIPEHEYDKAETKFACTSKGKQWLRAFAYPVQDNKGQILEIVVIQEDITARKQTELELNAYRNHLETLVKLRTEELLVAKNMAEAANQAKSTFIATMSHELRTPLNAILGFSELMTQDHHLTPKQKEMLNIIHRSGSHLLNMINDVLNISRIESGRLELNIESFDLPKLLNEITNIICIQVAEKHLRFNAEIAADIPQYVKGDSGKLRQILLNLLNNAVKFTERGCIILQVSAKPAKENKIFLHFTVIDSGIGISKEQQKLLFKPFTQLTRLNSGLEGSGLGLTISKSLIELMGGQIRVVSELGNGSNFHIELPISLADASEVETALQYPPVIGLEPNQPVWRILVVDDNIDNRILLVMLLSSLGFAVQEAENGQEAVTAFEQWHPDLIWMDMRMPVMDGYEATRKIRALPGGEKVKIIALTASVFKEQHVSMIEAGCDAITHKPFQTQEIYNHLMNYLGVKFVYETPTTSDNNESGTETATDSLTDLPESLREQLYKAALNLDIEGTEAVIMQIQSVAPKVAENLRKLVENYQFEQIMQLSQMQRG